jgi:hypothetical protein
MAEKEQVSDDRRAGAEGAPVESIGERWDRWLESSGQVHPEEPPPRAALGRWLADQRLRIAQWRQLRADRVLTRGDSRKPNHVAAWRIALDERMLQRRERTRHRREAREAARLAAHRTREVTHARAAAAVAGAREAIALWRERGPLAVLADALARRRAMVAGICILMIASAVAGAGFMRARHRRYLTGALVAVNGVVIRRSDLNDDLHASHGAATLTRLVERELRTQFMRAHHSLAGDKQVEARFRLEAQIPTFFATLEEIGTSEADYRGALRRVLSEINLMSQGIEINDAEAREFYRRNVDPRNLRSLFYTPPIMSLAVIVTTQEGAAREALGALNARQPFGAVARAYSAHDSAGSGGLIPSYPLGRSVTASASGLEAVAAPLQEGEQVGPVRRNGVWWIVRCLGRKPAATRSYEEVKETVELPARMAKGVAKNKARLDAEYAEFRKQASIQRFAAR